MLYDESRLKMTRDKEEYMHYAASLSDSQKIALSKIGIENSKFLKKVYIRLVEEEVPVILMTDFMSFIDEVMIIYDANVYFEKRDNEIEKLMRGEDETERGKKP